MIYVFRVWNKSENNLCSLFMCFLATEKWPLLCEFGWSLNSVTLIKERENGAAEWSLGTRRISPCRSAAVHVHVQYIATRTRCIRVLNMYCTMYTVHVHTHARTYTLQWTHINCRLSIKLTRIFSHLANASRGCGRFAGFWGSFPLWKLLGENSVGIAALFERLFDGHSYGASKHDRWKWSLHRAEYRVVPSHFARVVSTLVVQILPKLGSVGKKCRLTPSLVVFLSRSSNKPRRHDPKTLISDLKWWSNLAWLLYTNIWQLSRRTRQQGKDFPRNTSYPPRRFMLIRVKFLLRSGRFSRTYPAKKLFCRTKYPSLDHKSLIYAWIIQSKSYFMMPLRHDRDFIMFRSSRQMDESRRQWVATQLRGVWGP